MKPNEAEVVLETLDLLGVALATQGHVWTYEERYLYTHSVRIAERYLGDKE